MSKFVRKIRYIKGLVFAVSAVPNDISGFLKDIFKVDENKLSEVERAWIAYELKERYVENLHHTKSLKRIIYSIIFPFAYIGILKKKNITIQEKRKIVYYRISDNQGILPEKYKNNKELQIVAMGEGMMLDEISRDILKDSFRISKGKLHFLMEELLALANYSYICNKYNPDEIITSYESAYANSVLTLYCHKKNIIHTNFMHGEKLLSPLNVLGYFDTMYVWDEHYISLFQQLKYRVGSYVIENPWEKISLPITTRPIDYTFFMNYEDEHSLRVIIEIANKLVDRGYSVRIRLHPSQIKEEKLKKIVPREMLDNEVNDIMQSISNTKFAVSRYSTVLYQAFINKKKIIIDDISNKQEFKQLKQLDYIMLNKKHELLSHVLEIEEIEC
nr:hypothetical protein [uncultured Blautia sp.]